MQDRLSAGKGRLARTVEVLRKVNSRVRKADSLYMYYAWLEAATISIVTLATFWGAGMLLSFGTTTITQQIFTAVALYYMLHTLFTAVAGAFKEYRLYLFNRKIGDVIDAISLEGKLPWRRIACGPRRHRRPDPDRRAGFARFSFSDRLGT
jgi:hypothetical protein